MAGAHRQQRLPDTQLWGLADRDGYGDHHLYLGGVPSLKGAIPLPSFPNPATEAWNVEWPHGTNAQLVLYNMQEQALRQEELQPGTNRVSALNLPPGMYVPGGRCVAGRAGGVVKW